MKKSTYFITFSLAFTLFLGFLFVGCGKTEKNKVSSYQIEVSYDGENSVKGKESVIYQNNSDNALSFLQFNLFANAFKNKDSVVTVAEEERAYYNGESVGDIQILSVKSGGENLTYTFDGDTQEIMKVSLLNEIYPDENVEIDIEFEIKLANINHRLGKGENTINLGNFYPIVSVYENGKGFYHNVYQPFGDPFYSQVASYNVTISCPTKFAVASSGDKVSEKIENGVKSLNFKGENMRDFAIVLSDKFTLQCDKSSVCEVEYYGYEGDMNIQKCLNVAKGAVNYFSKSFGAYPYNKLSVVKNSFVQGGMEYPGLVMISDEADDESLPYIIVHEVAHQWWYGAVGDNQCETAWLDEGLAEMSTLMFFRDNTGYGIDYKQTLDGCLNSYKIYEKVQDKVYGKVDGVMDKQLGKFASSPDYVALSYTKSTLMFSTLEEQLGKKKFLSALKDFYKNFTFKEASRADIIASFSSSSHRNLEGFFDSWLDGKVVIA